MGAEAVGRLTERERDCLRLVLRGYTTKEIARHINVTDLRAQKIIESANRKLGVSRRIEAARILAADEARGVSDAPGGSPTLPQPPDFTPLVPPEDQTRQPLALREERSAFGAAGETTQLGLPRRRSGGTSNDLTTWQRVIWIAILSSAALLGVGVLARGLSALSDQIIMLPSNTGR